MSRNRSVFYLLILVVVYIAGAAIGIPGVEIKTTAEATRIADGSSADQPSAVEMPSTGSAGDLEVEISEFTEETGRESEQPLDSEDTANVDNPVVNPKDKAPAAIAELDRISRSDSSQIDDSLQVEQNHRPLMNGRLMVTATPRSCAMS